MENKETNKIGYYSVIPATILYSKNLKPNQKLMYATITSLANKDGYCYATNKYLAKLYGVNENTVSDWINDMRRKNYIDEILITNEKNEVVQRRIYLRDVPSPLKNGYPLPEKNGEGIHFFTKYNNINNNNINTYRDVKKSYNENVFLYDYEYEQLINEYGKEKTEKCIEDLSLYKKSKGVEYERDYAAIKRWVVISVDEKEGRKNKIGLKSNINNKSDVNNKIINYEQREYTEDFFDSFYSNQSYDSEDMEV